MLYVWLVLYFYRTAGISGKNILSREKSKSTVLGWEPRAAAGSEPERGAEIGMDQIQEDLGVGSVRRWIFIQA